MRQFNYKINILILINKTKVRIMNKLKTLVASVVVATLSFGAANSIELRAGLTGQSTAYYASVEETAKDSGKKTSDDALAAFSYMSLFGEVAFDSAYGISIGVEYSPESINIDNADRVLVNSSDQVASGNTSTRDDSGTDVVESNDEGTQIIQAAVKDLTLIYVGIPVMDTGLTVKAGYHMSTLQTKETLVTGSSYKDEDLEGMSIGVYYDGAISDNLFYRLEGAYQQFDDIKVTGSESGADAASFNTITAQLGGVAAKASIGFKF